MIIQYTLSPELQQFLSGLQSKAVANVVFDATFSGDPPTLPSNPSTVRRSIMISRLDSTPEFNCFIKNMDGSGEIEISNPRSI
jgi:hypothetical protein